MCLYRIRKSIFLYERIHYLKSIVSEDELLELLAFMGQLQQYEAVRRNCEIELDKNNMVIHTIEYNKQLDNCYGRLDTDSEKGFVAYWTFYVKLKHIWRMVKSRCHMPLRQPSGKDTSLIQ